MRCVIFVTVKNGLLSRFQVGACKIARRRCASHWIESINVLMHDEFNALSPASTIMMKIHNFARGVRGQRVMWLCEEMGLPYTVQNHAFPVGADYRALNPLGTVPFLEHD